MKNKSNLFIGIVVLISVLMFAVLLLVRPTGARVVVTIDGEEYKSYPLNKNQTVQVDLGDGEYNIFVIRDGTVDMIASTCATQVCVNDYPISGDFPGVIVCLPHRLVVEIKE